MSNLLETFPGLMSAKYMWIDGDGNRHDMTKMDYAYLKNARNHIAKFIDGYSNTRREEHLLNQKIEEFDKALHLLSKKIREHKIPARAAKKTTLDSFNVRLIN